MKTKQICCAIVVLSSFVLMSFSGCVVRCDGNWPTEKGNGTIASETRELSQFDGVEIAGIGELKLELGEKPSVRVTTDENLISFVETKISGNRLILSNKKSLSPTQGITFHVISPNITFINASGAAAVVAQINNENLSVSQSGVGTIKLNGRTNNLTVDVSGAGSIHAEEMTANAVKASVSGVGSIAVTATDKLDADVSGAGSIIYSGNPTVNSNVSGIGSISKK